MPNTHIDNIPEPHDKGPFAIMPMVPYIASITSIYLHIEPLGYIQAHLTWGTVSARYTIQHAGLDMAEHTNLLAHNTSHNCCFHNGTSRKDCQTIWWNQSHNITTQIPPKTPRANCLSNKPRIPLTQHKRFQTANIHSLSLSQHQQEVHMPNHPLYPTSPAAPNRTISFTCFDSPRPA